MKQQAAALEAKDLMCGKSRHIKERKINIHLSQSLDEVAVHHGAGMRMHMIRNGADIIDTAGLIVHAHDRHENGVFAQRAAHIFQMHRAIGMQRQICHFESEHFFKLRGRAHDAGVLRAAGDDMPAPLLIGKGKRLQRIIVRFARA